MLPSKNPAVMSQVHHCFFQGLGRMLAVGQVALDPIDVGRRLVLVRDDDVEADDPVIAGQASGEA